jgi:hypothetical protein
VKKKTPVSWLKSEEEILVNFLIEHYHAGNSSDTGFKSHIFTDVAARLQEKPTEQGPEKDADSCHNKCNALKGNWKIVNIMISQSGWGWDKDTGLVTPDGFWNDYICTSTSEGKTISQETILVL